MQTIQFKTNIKCGGCVAAVTPYLRNISDIQDWEVDTNHPDKILTVKGEHVNPQRIVTGLQQAGYQAEQIR